MTFFIFLFFFFDKFFFVVLFDLVNLDYENLYQHHSFFLCLQFMTDYKGAVEREETQPAVEQSGIYIFSVLCFRG